MRPAGHADADELAEDPWRARLGMPPAAAAVQEGTKTDQAPPPRDSATTAPQAAGTRPRKRRSTAPRLLALLLLLLGLLGLGWAPAQTLGGPDVRVPPVEGLPREQA